MGQDGGRSTAQTAGGFVQVCRVGRIGPRIAEAFLGADRIDHGVRAIEDAALVSMLVE